MARDPKDHPDHIPVAKRLSGDFNSPVEVMADAGLDAAEKRSILLVWLKDMGPQPDSTETRELRNSIRVALESLDEDVK